MTFLSLAPVTSESYKERQQTQGKSSVTSQRHDCTISAARPSEGRKQLRFLKLGHHDGDWSEDALDVDQVTPSPMTFLSLAPVASESYIRQQSFHRHDSTASEASTSSEGSKGLRFLKLGHKDGDWSEEVVDV